MKVVCVLVLAVLVGQADCQQCSALCLAPGQDYAFMSADHNQDYLYLGAIFSIHEAGTGSNMCGAVRSSAIQNLEAFLWAVRTFRDRYPDKLRDVSLGAIAFDSCTRTEKVIQQVLNLEECQLGYGSQTHLVQPNKVMGYVGHESSRSTSAIADLFKSQDKTIIAHADTDQATSNIPYMLRTVLSDKDELKAIVAIVDKMQWKYVQTVSPDSIWAMEALNTFKTFASMKNISVANSQVIPPSPSQETMDKVIEGLRKFDQVKPVVLFGSGYIRHLLEAAERYGTRGQFIWIGSRAWGQSMEVVEGLEEYAEGAITVTLDNNVKGMAEFTSAFRKTTSSKVNPWLGEYTKGNNVSIVDMDEYVPYTILAVDTLLAGVEMVRSQTCNTYGLCNSFTNSDSKWAQIHEEVTKAKHPVSFNVSSGDTLSGNISVYNFRRPGQNCNSHCYTKVGIYSIANDDVNFFKADMMFYDSNGNRIEILSYASPTPASPSATRAASTTPDEKAVSEPKGPPSKLREGTWVIVLIVLAGVGMLLVIGVEIIILVKLAGTEIFSHWKSMWLGQLLLLAIFLSYLTLFAFVPSPTRAACGIIRFGVGGSYSMIFSILLVKLMVVLSSEKYGSLKGSYQFFMFLFAWGVQLAVDIEWLILRHPGAKAVSTTLNGWACENDLYEHVKSLVYIMGLILLCTLLAIQAHGTRANHRESIFIGLASGFTIPVWITWILIGLLKNDLEYQDPALAYGLFTTATVVLLVMFLPKMRQICRGVDYEDDYDGVPSILHGGSVVLAPEPGSISGGSVIQTKPEPVILAPSTLTTDHDSVILLPNGGVYTQPVSRNVSYQHDQNALYLKHPGSPSNTLRAESVHSMPVGHYYDGPQSSIYATNPRVLHVTGDLTGRPHLMANNKAQSEYNYNVYYGPAKKTSRSVGGASSRDGTVRKTRSIQDLGSL